jgi:uncharacterized protein YqiB (DUF1249 family)
VINGRANQMKGGSTMKERISISEVKDKLHIILSDEKAYYTSLNYAVNYIMYALEITDYHEMKVQLLYVLNNITGWRHPAAKEVRLTLKQFVKEN